MAKDTRRYFIAEGPDADQVRTDVLAKLNQQRAQQDEIAKKYGADQCLVWNDGRLAGLVYAGGDDAPEVAEGLALDNKQANPSGGFWYCFKPAKRGKAGKAIAADLATIKGFDGSREIVQRFDAYRGGVVDAPSSRTGMAYAMSAAGIVKDQVVLSVPVIESEPFDAPPSLREIKKSEYIALTEE